MSSSSSPGRLLRYALSVHRNQNSTNDEAEKFAREYVAKIAPLHVKNGIEAYQLVSRFICIVLGDAHEERHAFQGPPVDGNGPFWSSEDLGSRELFV
jgi:hypothetical protein